MNTNQKDILKSLGFNTDLEGTKYFLDIIEDISIEILKGTEEKEVIEKIPSICLEYYHFYYEIGRKTFESKLTEFHDSRHQNKKYGFNKLLYQSIYGNIKNPTMEQSAIAISKYVINQNILPPPEQTESSPKVFIK